VRDVAGRVVEVEDRVRLVAGLHQARPDRLDLVELVADVEMLVGQGRGARLGRLPPAGEDRAEAVDRERLRVIVAATLHDGADERTETGVPVPRLERGLAGAQQLVTRVAEVEFVAVRAELRGALETRGSICSFPT
jgi:hypothetical protein